MFYLIDGYNLLHALGLLRRGKEPAALEKARRALLGFLKGAHGSDAAAITVVFDAANAPPGVPSALEYQGIHVQFAVHQDQADDLIEQIIQQESAPRSLILVSDDHRLHQAARRRQCGVMACTAYLDSLLDRHHPPRRTPPPEEPAKPTEVSPEETQNWLRVFANLADDPAIKELFDPYGFLEDKPGEPPG